jgi:hypothetical protein
MKPVAIGRLVKSPTVEESQQEITRLRAEVERLRMTDEEREAVASWATQCSAFGLFKIAGFLNALAERHGRDAAPIV